MELRFSGRVVEWRGPAPHHFVAVPADLAAEVAEVATALTYGWGVVPVTVVLGSTTWTTSMIPRHGGYLVPLRLDVRRREGVGPGDVVELTLRLAATVVDVLPNGHFVIQGDHEVRVNFELRELQITGIVRPEDISRHNEIVYDKIAGARIAYGGRGQITDVQQPRYGQQLSDIAFRLQLADEGALMAETRSDMHPAVAVGLGLEVGVPVIGQDRINGLLAGRRADGEKIEGKHFVFYGMADSKIGAAQLESVS